MVARPRVARLIADLIEANHVVLVVATPGAGKSTAVVEAAQLVPRALAWLTLDRTDSAAGRLLVYLEAAIAGAAPGAAGVASGAMAARLPHGEAAGLLAEAVDGTPTLLVVDGLEHLAGAEAAHALEALGAFLRYAPPELRVALLGRVDVPLDVAALTGIDRVASVGEEALAFTPEEAAAALRRAGTVDVDAGQVVAATGGWVTGVLFEAWRSREHVTGTGGEVDPLHGYLSTQILGRLTPEERELLTVTALLDEVTPERAAALGVARAGELLVELRTKHLPVTWTPATYHLRCHPRFREYLLARLQRRAGSELRHLRRTYGELLATEGHHEEAVEEFLAAEEPDRAVAAAEVALPPVIDRLDLHVADRWLARLASPGTSGARTLAEAELMLALTREDYRTAAAVGDRLLAQGDREDLAATSSRAASMMAWAYWHVARLEDARTLVATAPPSDDLDAVRYLMTLVEPPRRGTTVAPRLTGGPLDALVMRVLYAHGRLPEVLVAPASPWAAAVSAPWRVGALRASGRLGEALDLYRAAEAGNRSPAWLYGMVGPELMIDLSRTEEALAVLARGHQDIRASGSVVFEWLNRIIEAKLELRLRHDVAAGSGLLRQVEADGARAYGFLAEGLDTWSGLAALLAGETGRAQQLLRRAVESMVTADRLLDLPTAAVYLAEAEWRMEDPDAADAAADRALTASQTQGSNHQMLMALADFPAVASRRLDAEAMADSPWHEVGRALLERGVRIEVRQPSSVTLVEFGRTAIVSAGSEVRPRITKSVLLLAFLATRPDHEATRAELLEALFDGRDDESAKAYLRQAVHRLREVLPEHLGPAFVGSTLRFAQPVTVSSESVAVQAQLSEAAGLREGQQRETLMRALEVLDRGQYLPGLESAWVARRRSELEELAVRARLRAARAAFSEEDFAEAGRLVEATLARDPYQESAWRLLMRVGSAVGDEDRVITGFRRCHAALADLGVQPSEATQTLFDRLRR